MSKTINYQGIRIIHIDSKHVREFYSQHMLHVKFLPKDTYYPNENLILKSESEQSSGLGIIKGEFVHKISDKIDACGIKGKNKEQVFALNMLLDPSIQVVTLTGIAGSGKTLLAVSAGLAQTFGKNVPYTKIIYAKSVIPVGKEIGFLPGSIEEKVDPFLGAIHDAMSICRTKQNLDELTGWSEKDKIQKLPLSFIRGRTFRRTYIICDEAQNLTTHELKSIMTRLDDGCKIVILGDTEQADIRLKQEDQGLIKVVETFKDHELFGHINMLKSERSRLAQVVGERL